MTKQVLRAVYLSTFCICGGFIALSSGLVEYLYTQQFEKTPPVKLVVSNQQLHAYDSIVINPDIATQTTGEKEWVITNTDSEPGSLVFKATTFATLQLTTPTTQPRGTTNSDHLISTSSTKLPETTAVLKVDSDADGNFAEEAPVVTTIIDPNNLDIFAKNWNEKVAPLILKSGETKSIKLFWKTEAANRNDSTSTQKVMIDVEFGLQRALSTL